MSEDVNLFNSVLFSDECSFHNNGTVKRHYYSDYNPHQLRIIHSQHRWSVNVWDSIIGQYLIGPYLFEEYLNGM